MEETLSHADYTIAWICALEVELTAARGMLDAENPDLDSVENDTNTYTLGRIGKHNIVIACLPAGLIGTTSAATVAINLLRTFSNIRFGLMVGIGGGAPGLPDIDHPENNIHLGDVVISEPGNASGGVIQYDFGITMNDGKFVQTGYLNQPPTIILNAVEKVKSNISLYGQDFIKQHFEEMLNRFPRLQQKYRCPGIETDRLFLSNYTHPTLATSCVACDPFQVVPRPDRDESSRPTIHYGLIGSANQLIMSSSKRDELRATKNIICFEMEASGLMMDFPCLVIRGISDYCDGHKNKQWQPYAAAASAAYAKELLSAIPPTTVAKERLAREVIGILDSQSIAIKNLKTSADELEAKLDLKGLPTVPTAAFDSHEDYDAEDATCLSGTRVDILQTIHEWIIKGEKTIFWLNGMAGTGKSTIARSVAEHCNKIHRLGGSFFFKRGEGDRQSCRYLFTTIACQLAQSLPMLRKDILDAIGETPEIGHKALKEQFDKLILCPLRSYRLRSPMLLVIDALDECEDEDKVHIIIFLLSRLRSLGYIKILLTSRREQYIDWHFQDTAREIFDDIELHEMTETSIEHDISIYLNHKFDQINQKRTLKLPPGWPGQEALNAMTSMSTPLFIFAATVCRYIGHHRSDPVTCLQSIMEGKQTGLSRLNQTYNFILQAILNGSSEEEHSYIVEQICTMLGMIVILVEPLTAWTLNQFLNIGYHKINHFLRQLTSVLRLTADLDKPIRTFHASFGDYLLTSPEKHKFSIDASHIHHKIALRCLDLLEYSQHLSKGDICDLKIPSKSSYVISKSTIDEKLPAEIRYACCHWVHHLKESGKIDTIIESRVSKILKTRLLLWFEALSLMNRTREAIIMLSELLEIFHDDSYSTTVQIIYDCWRFVRANSHMIDLAPLQLYSSSVVFSPQTSIVRLNNPIPQYIKTHPITPDRWDALQQTLEGHTGRVTDIAYSPDGKLLASAAGKTVILWEASSGQQHQSLLHNIRRPYDLLCSIAFFPHGGLLVTGTRRGMITIWNIKSGEQVQIMHDAGGIDQIVVSQYGKLLASSPPDPGKIKLWDAALGKLKQELPSDRKYTGPVAFYPCEDRLLASCCLDYSIELWDVYSLSLLHVFKGHVDRLASIVFSPGNDKLLVSSSMDMTTRFWDINSGEVSFKSLEHKESFSCMDVSRDGGMLAIALSSIIRIWNMTSEQPQLYQELRTNSSPSMIALDPLGKMLAATSSYNPAVQVWSTRLGDEKVDPHGVKSSLTTRNSIEFLRFSPDGRFLVSCDISSTVRLYSINSGRAQLRKTFPAGGTGDHIITISPDSKLFLFTADGGRMLQLCSTSTAVICATLCLNSDEFFHTAVYSSDSRLVLTCSKYWGGLSTVFRLWDVHSGRVLRTFGVFPYVMGMACSDGGKFVAYYRSYYEIELLRTKDQSLRHIKTPRRITELSFRANSAILETNLGTVDGSKHPDSWSLEGQAPAEPLIAIQNEGILSKGQKLLWLPLKYREMTSCSGNLMAFGLDTGELVTIEFDLEKISQMTLS